jgi:tetratricopeptide (TPR) repeat protein
MDPDNPVIRLCVQGAEAEAQARFDEARALYEHAWRASRDDLEACIAAHYIARRQHNPDQALWWNQIALARADSVRDGSVRAFYASLHLNLGMAHENLGQLAAARLHYERAADTLHDITDDNHRVLVQYGVTRGLKRTEQS